MNSTTKCLRCLADQSFDSIVFYQDGTCNYCRAFFSANTIPWARLNSSACSTPNLLKLISEAGKGKKYDCVIGISGGVDSSYLLTLAVRFGLRPFVVHMNNTWNDALADQNISRLVRKLNLQLNTSVLDAISYDAALNALIKANVVDLEILYDNAAFTTCYQAASCLGIKFILGGQNYQTEGYVMPPSWNWFKYDKRNIYAICNRFSNFSPKALPLMGTIDYLRYTYLDNIQIVPFLDFFPYSKEDALNELETSYGYTRYPYKHYESKLTRFYQGFILPTKFSIDKRRGHLSSLVLTNQMSLAQAKEILNSSAYPDRISLLSDQYYFLSRLGLSEDDFNEYLLLPRKEHSDYPSEYPLWKVLSRFKQLAHL